MKSPKKNHAKKSGPGFHGVAKQVLSKARDHNRAPVAENDGKPVYRSVFISDVHLGSERARADRLLAFLGASAMERLYLVGDIVDGWRFVKYGHWPTSHSRVLDAIFAMANGGSEVVFTPGNHDHLFRAYLGRNVRGIEIRHDLIFETADGRRFWVVHGDQFDKTAYVPAWLFHAGDLLNRGLHGVNEGYNAIRKRMGMSRKCLVAYLKNTSKHGGDFKQKFAKTISLASAAKGVDGVICGHIHKAEQRAIAGVTYINTGDWVESCSALVEHFDGRLEIIHWGAEARLQAAE